MRCGPSLPFSSSFFVPELKACERRRVPEQHRTDRLRGTLGPDVLVVEVYSGDPLSYHLAHEAPDHVSSAHGFHIHPVDLHAEGQSGTRTVRER